LKNWHQPHQEYLSTVSAIASQSLRNVAGAEHAQQAIDGRRWRWAAHDLFLQAR